MAKAEIPDWFDLKVYQEPLSRNQWLARIGFRVGYLAFKPQFRDLTEQEEMFRFYSGIFPRQFNLPECHMDPLPVRPMIAADLAAYSAFWSWDQSWQALYQKMRSIAGEVDPRSLFDEVLDIYGSGATLKKEVLCNAGWLGSQTYSFCHGAPITVNLNNDDETIKQSFSVWLAGVRSEMSERFKKPVSDEDFQKWHKYRIMAAFDLCQWAEIKGFRYTNKQLANALFPPESIEYEERDVDMTERVRKLVKPLMSQCFTHETVRLLEAAVRLEAHLGQVNSSTP